MTPRLQTRQDGTGDCVRACIAGLFNLRVEDVPDFTAGDLEAVHETGYPVWYLKLQNWLAGKGFFFLEVQLSQKTWNPIPFEAFAIFIGERATTIPNPNFNPAAECTCEDIAIGHFAECPKAEFLVGSCRHAIVGKCEGESFLPIFDPLGGNPLQAFVNGRIEAVCFLVPLDPALQINLGKAADSALRLARQLPWSELKEAIVGGVSEALGVATVMLPTAPDPNGPRIITRDEPTTGGGIVLPK